uniref:Uncharacterized protein n=1 Tax=Ditylenchus dipsaci TaxID=166011 RepID=A0A915DCA7_9BILA
MHPNAAPHPRSQVTATSMASCAEVVAPLNSALVLDDEPKLDLLCDPVFDHHHHHSILQPIGELRVDDDKKITFSTTARSQENGSVVKGVFSNGEGKVISVSSESSSSLEDNFKTTTSSMPNPIQLILREISNDSMATFCSFHSLL